MRVHNTIFEKFNGYYFRTEDDDVEGPFPTKQIAQQVYEARMKWLDEDEHPPLRKMRDSMGV